MLILQLNTVRLPVLESITRIQQQEHAQCRVQIISSLWSSVPPITLVLSSALRLILRKIQHGPVWIIVQHCTNFRPRDHVRHTVQNRISSSMGLFSRTVE
jgi:hypothetical protein